MTTLLATLAFLIQSIIALIAAFVVLTYIITLYEKRLTLLQARFNDPDRKTEIRGISTGRVLYTALLEFLTTLALVALTPIQFKRFDPAAPGGERNRPILLVHGYCHNQSGWVYFRKRLKESRMGPVYSLNLNPPFGSIERFASLVAKKAERIESETGVKELILIGHSMGGVVISYYAEHLAPEGKVTDVITLGSPMRGTRLAAVGWGPNAVSMAPGSPLIVDLEKRILENRKTRYHFVGSQLDNMIHPSDAVLLGEDASRQLMLDDHGHAMLLFSPTVVQQAIRWLDPVYRRPLETSEAADDVVG